ncbi:MAG: rhomboid family intramembrane serine protease [Solirubrobacteraceae bacterium]
MIPLKDNIPASGFPLVTVLLLAANVIAYLLAIRSGGSLWSGPDAATAVHYGAIPYEFTHPGSHCDLLASGQLACGPAGALPPQPSTAETAITSMFMHGGLLHLAGNMLFLWIFGDNVEDAVGHARFLLFYVLGGLAALALQIAVAPGSGVPTVGASGAIACVLGGYIVLYPRARVLTLIFIIFFVTLLELPALLLLGIWFAEQALFGAAGLASPVGDSGGVAYFAHVGGFVFGLLLIRSFAVHRRRPLTCAR